MLNRKDFFAIFIGQIVITVSLMALAAKTHCNGNCEGMLSIFVKDATPIAAVD